MNIVPKKDVEAAVLRAPPWPSVVQKGVEVAVTVLRQ